jgi:hypothetical protein
MKNLLYQLSIYLFLILLSCQCYAQINIKCAGKNYYIPEFKDWPVKPKYTPMFEMLNVLTPITESKYDIEIRANYYTLSLNSGMTITIKGNAQELIVQTMRYNYAGNIADSLKPKGTKIAKQGNLKYFYSVKSITAPDTLLTSLIKNHLFNFDEKAIKDNLAKAKTEIYDRNVLDGYSIGFEVKAKDHYRAFGISPDRYPLNIKELKPIGLLDYTFGTLIKLTR